MKEADKNLLKEIAHLSRLIKKKEKVKHVAKKFSNFPPTQFINPASSVNKFKFFKPTVTPNNVFSKSKYPTLTSSKFKFCKPAPTSTISSSSSSGVSSAITLGVLHNPTKIGAVSSLVSQNSSAGIQKNVTNPNSSSRVFINPKHVIPSASSSLGLDLDAQVARRNVNSNPYKFRKADLANLSITSKGVPVRCSSREYSLKDKARIDVQTGTLRCKSNNLPITNSELSSKNQTSASTRLPSTNTVFHSISQNAVGNLAAISVNVSKGTNITKSDSKQIVRFKQPNPVQSKTAHNMYKLDRRTKITLQSYSQAKNGPKRLKRCVGKNADKKYIVTRHSLRKLKDSPKRFIVKSRRIPTISSKYSVASKIVKIQGATYESRNKGKTLNRIRTSSTSLSQFSKVEFKFSQTPVKKLASQVLKKCKTTLIKNRQKRNVFCKFYNMFGVCKRLEDGTCRFVHDNRQVFVCSKFIVGKCDNENCTLSHNLENGKIPPCRFFKIGRCTRNDCPYSHVISKKKSQMRKLKSTSAAAVGDVKPEKKAVVNVAMQTKCVTETTESKNKLTKNVQQSESSRYYQRIPNSNPVKALIPRRLPLSLATPDPSESDSESDSDSNVSDDSETQYVSDGSSDSDCNSGKNEGTVESDDKKGVESSNSILQSVAIMASAATNAEVGILDNSASVVTDSTSEKRLRLLGLQNNLKRRAAAIRNENQSAD